MDKVKSFRPAAMRDGRGSKAISWRFSISVDPFCEGSRKHSTLVYWQLDRSVERRGVFKVEAFSGLSPLRDKSRSARSPAERFFMGAHCPRLYRGWAFLTADWLFPGALTPELAEAFSCATTTWPTWCTQPMPVLLRPRDLLIWLDGSTEEVLTLVKPADA
ncbi:hypothetical protein Q4F19_08165 [Sphingomonas sp. BIUV-7]|uniref:SOS response associated peptidase (SRAP) n=1 Tax=Sphingomonas natans TaxID=3063330 RepID=A0ABT8Y7P9_9SPHN|nr:hypothetical protein [Sphingomonas sp. BIUV-7]MDO6414352.1 hypothetical protein [Sphingomonas sp. BIUV-7]